MDRGPRRPKYGTVHVVDAPVPRRLPEATPNADPDLVPDGYWPAMAAWLASLPPAAPEPPGGDDEPAI